MLVMHNKHRINFILNTKSVNKNCTEIQNRTYLLRIYKTQYETKRSFDKNTKYTNI